MGGLPIIVNSIHIVEAAKLYLQLVYFGRSIKKELREATGCWIGGIGWEGPINLGGGGVTKWPLFSVLAPDSMIVK